MLAALDGGVHVQPARVGFIAVLGVDELAGHFGGVLGRYRGGLDGGADVQRLFFGFIRFGLRDEMVGGHAVQDVMLADARTRQIADGVVGRRRLRQPGQHGRFSQRDVLQGLAEVGFGRCRKAVGAVAQIDLVHIDLKNLVLGELLLELVGEQHLVELAGVGLFRAEVGVARHLHGDGGSALAFDAAQVGESGAQNADVVHAAMLVKARVFNGHHGIAHHFGNVIDRHHAAALFAELADQIAIGAVHAQGLLGVIVQQLGDVWQIGVGQGKGDAEHKSRAGRHGCQRGQNAGTEFQNAARHRRRGVASTGRCGFVHKLRVFLTFDAAPVWEKQGFMRPSAHGLAQQACQSINLRNALLARSVAVRELPRTERERRLHLLVLGNTL